MIDDAVGLVGVVADRLRDEIQLASRLDFEPAANIEEAAELRAAYYTKGAEEPIVAIIEYGDFQ